MSNTKTTRFKPPEIKEPEPKKPTYEQLIEWGYKVGERPLTEKEFADIAMVECFLQDRPGEDGDLWGYRKDFERLWRVLFGWKVKRAWQAYREKHYAE